MFGEELFIRLTVRVFHGRWSNFVCVILSLCYWYVNVLIPDHAFLFSSEKTKGHITCGLSVRSFLCASVRLALVRPHISWSINAMVLKFHLLAIS